MNSYEAKCQEDARLAILVELSKQLDETLNVLSLSRMLDAADPASGVRGAGTFSQWSIGIMPATDAITADSVGSLTNKRIDLGSNVLTGTTAQFNAALSDGNFVTETASQPLYNKAFVNPVIVGTITQDTYAITDGPAVVIDPGNGSQQYWTLGASRTATFANFIDGDQIDLWVDDGAGYGLTLTGANYVGGVQPQFRSSGWTRLVLTQIDGALWVDAPMQPSTDLVLVGYTTDRWSDTGAAHNVSLTGLLGGIGAAPQENDIVVVFQGSSAANSGTAPAVPTGYTNIGTATSSDTYSSGLRGSLKVMGATPDTTVSLPGVGAGRGASAHIRVYRNVSTVTPLDAAAVTAVLANSILIDPAAITPATGNAELLVCGFGAHGSTEARTFGSTDFGDLLNTAYATGGSTGTALIAVGTLSNPIATFNPAAFTFSTGDSISYSACSITVLLRKA